MKTIAEARAARDIGIERAADGAGEDWKASSFAFIERYCRTHPVVFCDDLWRGGLEPPQDGRALGALMRRAARAGLIRKTGQYRPSVPSNMTPKPVWESLVCGGAP